MSQRSKQQVCTLPAFIDAVQALQSDADRQKFVRGLLDIDDAHGTQTVQRSDVSHLEDLLTEATEKAAFAGHEQAEGTASGQQLDEFNARYKTWMAGLEPWKQAVESVLQNVTVGGTSGREWSPHQPGSKDYGSAD